MSLSKFIDEWKYRLAGLALYGTVSDVKDGPMVRAQKMFLLPAEIEMLLTTMHASAQPVTPPDTYTVDQIVEMFMDHYQRMTIEQGKELREKIRGRLNPGSK